MSVTTISATFKGNMQSNSDTNWNDLQTNANAGTLSYDTFEVRLERASWRRGTRGLLTFDTSSIADGATISAVTLRIYGNNDYTPSLGGNLVITAQTSSSNTTVVSGDYNKSNFGASVGSIAFSSLSSSAANNDISITTSQVNKTGYTKLGGIHTYDYDNSDPGNGDFAGCLARFSTASLLITWTTPPVVTTGSATSVTSTTATLGGNITDAGGGTVSTAGVCWGTSADPTTSNSKTATSTTSGAFTVAATGLISGVLYHYRSYVTTENSTTYGADTTFRTIFGGNFIPFI